jgi:hypothetical protein
MPSRMLFGLVISSNGKAPTAHSRSVSDPQIRCAATSSTRKNIMLRKRSSMHLNVVLIQMTRQLSDSLASQPNKIQAAPAAFVMAVEGFRPTAQRRRTGTRPPQAAQAAFVIPSQGFTRRCIGRPPQAAQATFVMVAEGFSPTAQRRHLSLPLHQRAHLHWQPKQVNEPFGVLLVIA